MAKKFTELTTASQINETDITAISQETGGVWGSFKATISAIAQKIITGINFANAFNTSDKTVAGAVNEKLTSIAVANIEVSPAESAHSVGDYIIYNGIQYKVTSAIAIGDSLVINTNIEAETLDTRINNIDSKIDDISDPYENFLAVGQRYLDTIQIKLKTDIAYRTEFSIIGHNAYGALQMVISKTDTNIVSAQYIWNNNGTPTIKYTTGSYNTSTKTIILDTFDGSFVNWNVFNLRAIKGIVDTFSVTSHL